MTKNVGQIDKIIRIIAGLLFIVLPFMGTMNTWSWIAVVVGIVLLGTGFMGTCPAYKLLGMNTCSTTHKPQT